MHHVHPILEFLTMHASSLTRVCLSLHVTRSCRSKKQAAAASAAFKYRAHLPIPRRARRRTLRTWRSCDGHEGFKGGGEEEDRSGGDRREQRLRRLCPRRGGGGGEERAWRRRRRGDEAGEPVHGRQPGAPHRARHRSAVSACLLLLISL